MLESFRDLKREHQIFRSRAVLFGILAFLMFCALIWRMAYLQISLHEKYFDLSENNRLQLRPIAPNRGLIYDRNGRSEEHTSELQSRPHLVCRLLLEKKKYIM